MPPASSILALMSSNALFKAVRPSVRSRVCVVTTYNGGAIKFICKERVLESWYEDSQKTNQICCQIFLSNESSRKHYLKSRKTLPDC